MGAPEIGTGTPADTGSNAGGESDYLYATQPEGKSLPEHLMRIRLPYEQEYATKFFDQGGNKVDNGFRFNATGGAIVIEYGLTNKASLQIESTYITKDKQTLNQGAFANTPQFQSAKMAGYASQTSLQQLGQQTGVGTITSQAGVVTAATTAIAAGLAKQGVCPSVQACSQAIAAGQVTAPAGGISTSLGTIPADAKVNDFINQTAAGIDQQITQGVYQQAQNVGGADGAVGFGDTQIGVLYEVYHSKPISFAVAGGVRFDTGKNPQLGTNQYPTTRGTTELGVRFNLDLLPVDWFMISWQNESDYSIMKGHVTNYDGSYLPYGGDPGAQLSYARKGVRNVGFVYLKPSLVPLSHYLNVLAPRLGITYDHDSTIVINGVDSPQSALNSYYAGLGIDLTRYSLPFQFDIEYTDAFSGQYYFATQTLTYTLKAYYAF